MTGTNTDKMEVAVVGQTMTADHAGMNHSHGGNRHRLPSTAAVCPTI
ncbi:MAG: hypothetical protein H7Y38_01165 [Armatimonadetes bacterium]|nr:hypothetical protein [Armatimonadota bacterium]